MRLATQAVLIGRIALGAALGYVAAMFAVLDALVVWWARRLFTRERLMSRR